MVYRELGKTGLLVSEIGLGCEGFVGKDEAFAKKLLEHAAGHGINCMDMYSPDPDMRSRIGIALAGRKEPFVLQGHLCAVWQNGQYKRTRDLEEVSDSFEDLLSRLGMPCIDIGMIHYVDSLQDWQEVVDSGIMEYTQMQKQKGRIKAVGLSSHNPIAALEAVKSGMIEVLMFSVNPCYDLLPGDENIELLWAEQSYDKQLTNMDPDRERLYEECQRRGVGITVMKAFGGGDLLSDASPAGKALSVNQCLHYALTRPAVATVFAGAHNMEQLQSSLDYETAPDIEKDYGPALASFPRISWQGHCMYCGHCAPCPKGIDIAAVTKFLTLAMAQKELPETVREHYRVQPHKAGECIQCRACEQRCPFAVGICENMKQARQVFGE